ncbi:Hypothetical protein SMAX5B_017891 [Scophthalmus maximus]|uniref:Uncharacterized protein n=1 Tax=Scophthalmus maximus TaxID=52904 RepID=A0A2U9CDX9_SCOMX|nr:Hypothetical protein SMAX5B_017891 [Scophthalmus maximus]
MDMQKRSYNRWTDDEVKALLSIFGEDDIQGEIEMATLNEKEYATCQQPDLHKLPGTSGHGGNADNNGSASPQLGKAHLLSEDLDLHAGLPTTDCSQRCKRPASPIVNKSVG